MRLKNEPKGQKYLNFYFVLVPLLVNFVQTKKWNDIDK